MLSENSERKTFAKHDLRWEENIEINLELWKYGLD
jgi:hypothetical protein